MAMEVPVVAPNNTVFPEQLGENTRGYLVPCAETLWIDSVGYRPYALNDDVASALKIAYQDFSRFEQGDSSNRENPLVQAAYAWIQQFRWEVVLKQWTELFGRIIDLSSTSEEQRS